MKSMNEVVQGRLGALSMSLCEAEIVISDRDARIAELEEEIEALKRKASARKKGSAGR